MPYIYEHVEAKVLNTGQKNQYQAFISMVWTGVTADVTEAKIFPQPGNNVIAEVTGTKTTADPGQLPTPPFDLVESESGYKYVHTDRVALSAPQLAGMNGFVNSAWPGHQDDVSTITFRAVDVDGTPEIHATIHGTITVANINQLPSGRVRVRQVT